MARARLIHNAKRYVVLLEEDTLIKFKQVSYVNDIKPQAAIRSLMEDFVESHRSDSSTERTRVEVVNGVVDQIRLLSDKNGRFKLNDLVCAEAMGFVKEVRALHAAYLNAIRLPKCKIALNRREHISITFADGVYTMKSTAHDFVITVKGFFIYVQLPRTYIRCQNKYAKYTMVNNLLTTLTEMTTDYRGQVIDILSKKKNVPVLRNLE